MEAKKVLETLEARFGVPPEFAGPLMPMLDRLAAQRPTAAEWQSVLRAVAEAYRASRGEEAGEESVAEVCNLMGQFASELRKLEESLKVLGVYLERVRQQTAPAPLSRTLH